jgi:hypothetical protein
MDLGVAGEGADGRAPHALDLAVGQRLSGEAMQRAGIEPEDVARVVEVADLPAPVRRHPAGPDHTADDTVEALGVIVLSIDFLVLREGDRRPEALEGRDEGGGGPPAVGRQVFMDQGHRHLQIR